jgi:hypothetical protein
MGARSSRLPPAREQDSTPVPESASPSRVSPSRSASGVAPNGRGRGIATSSCPRLASAPRPVMIGCGGHCGYPERRTPIHGQLYPSDAGEDRPKSPRFLPVFTAGVGLKIPWGSPPVWVRFPPPAPTFQALNLVGLPPRKASIRPIVAVLWLCRFTTIRSGKAGRSPAGGATG